MRGGGHERSATDPGRGAAAVRTIAVGPLSQTIELAALQRWFRAAKPGERIVFGTGPAFPRSAATAIQVTEWRDAGLVRVHHVRAAAHGFDFVAVRAEGEDGDAASSAASSAARSSGRARGERRIEAGDETPQAKLLRWLKRSANMNLTCPTNPEVANAYGLKNAQAASHLFRTLREAGLIRIDEPGPGLRRTVTIVATGLRTRGGPV